MPVDRCARNAEQSGDLLDCVLAGVVKLLGVRGLLGGQTWPAAALASAGSSGRKAVAGVGDDQLAL